MAKLKKTKEPVILKKQKYPEIHLAIENAMLSFKDILGEKKYQNRISKAVKVLVHGLDKLKTTKPASKKLVPIKAATKIITPKKASEEKKVKVVASKKVAIKKALKK